MSISDKALTRSLYNALHRYYCTFDLDWDPEAEEFQIITTPVVAEPYLEEILQGRRKAEQQQERKARHALAQQLSISEWLAGARSEDEAMDLFCEYNNCRYGEDALEEDQRALEASFEEDFGGPKSASAMIAELPPSSQRSLDRYFEQRARENQYYDDAFENLESLLPRGEIYGLTEDDIVEMEIEEDLRQQVEARYAAFEEDDGYAFQVGSDPIDEDERIDYDVNYDDEHVPDYGEPFPDYYD